MDDTNEIKNTGASSPGVLAALRAAVNSGQAAFAADPNYFMSLASHPAQMSAVLSAIADELAAEVEQQAMP